MNISSKFILFINCFTFCIFLIGQEETIRSKDRYQFGFEPNIGFAQIERASFTAGPNIGIFTRLKNHQFALRGTFYQELQFTLFGENNLFATLNTYYAYLFYFPRINIGPQLGGGYFKNEDFIENKWHRYNLVASVYFSFHVKGKGFNIQPYFSWNPKYNYYGLSLGGTFGKTWK